MKNTGGWLQGIQYFRAIAIIEVVLFHVAETGALAPNPLWIPVVLAAFTSLGVPHFIFISGVVLYNKYSNGFSLSTFYKKRLSSVVPPYVVWTTFYFALLFVLLPIYSPLPTPNAEGFGYFGSSNQSVATLVSTYLVQLAQGNWHLWFIRIIILLYLLYPLLVKMYSRTTRQNSPIYILSVLLLVSIGYSSLGIVVPVSQWSVVFGSFGYVLRYVFTFLAYVFYFVFGFFIAQRYDAMKQSVAKLSLKSISLVVLAATIYYVIVSYYGVLSSPELLPYTWLNVFTGPLYCLLLILFYLRITTTWGEPRGFFLSYIEKIGEDSFGIFLVHFFIFGMWFGVLTMLGLSLYNLLLYPVLFLFTIVSSYVVVEALYRLPFSNIILGARRKKQVSVNREHTPTRPVASGPTALSDSAYGTGQVDQPREDQ